MDKTVATFIGVVCSVVGLHATRAMHQTNITGKISGRDSTWVYAVNGSDSLKTMVNNGQFRFSSVKPGSYKVVIKETHASDGKVIDVVEGSTLDLGTIVLN